MERIRPKTVVRTSVVTPRSGRAFEVCAHHAREWLTAQTNDWQLRAPTFSSDLEVEGSASARFIVQQSTDSLAFMFAHADERARDTEWQIHAAITSVDTQAAVNLEIIVEGVRPPVVPPLGMPSFMSRIVVEPGLLDTWPLTLQPRPITTENAKSFVDFVKSTDRQLPILAFSSPIPLAPEEVARICRRVAGAAHVVNIDIPASFLISDYIGSKFSVYRGAIRVYHHGLGDNAFSIPLFFPHTIERLNEGRLNGPFGPIRFPDVLVRTVLDRAAWTTTSAEPLTHRRLVAPENNRAQRIADVTVSPEPTAPELGHLLPSISQTTEGAVTEAPATGAVSRDLTEFVKALEQKIFELEIAHAVAEEELEKSRLDAQDYYDGYFKVNQELEALRTGAQTDFLGDLGNVSEQDRSVLSALSEAMKAVRTIIVRSSNAQEENQTLRERVDDLTTQIAKQNAIVDGFLAAKEPVPTVAVAPRMPTDYHDTVALRRYIEERHQGRLILHQDFMRTLTDGVYADSEHLVACLDLLGSAHFDMRVGVEGGKIRFDAERHALGVKCSPALKETSIGEYGKYYNCTHDGKHVEVRDVWHIRSNGKTYVPERMLGLYFFWDESKRATVVFSGPRKLPTSSDRS